MERHGHSPRQVEYLDFDVEVEVGARLRYLVDVRSPAGEAREEMRFPFTPNALEGKLKDLEIALLRSGRTVRRIAPLEEQAVQDFGRALFDALFTGEVRSRYDASLREASLQGKGLRIRLRVTPPDLASLPWEFLYDARQGDYVCLSTNTPIVRYPEMPLPIEQLPVTPPLRILGLVASTPDLPALDVEHEQRRVEEAIADLRTRGLVELSWLEGNTWRDLQKALRRGPWHIFHFIGHGGFEAARDEGLIALAGEAGGSHLLPATSLARLLDDHASLRLVLLNSCEGARGSERDAFSGTAATLMRRGIPAVLAMQYEITDEAAIEFSRAFYEAVADGLPVDGAVAEARTAVSVGMGDSLEWGTPVLYMRSPNGYIFDVRRADEGFGIQDSGLSGAVVGSTTAELEHVRPQQQITPLTPVAAQAGTPAPAAATQGTTGASAAGAAIAGEARPSADQAPTTPAAAQVGVQPLRRRWRERIGTMRLVLALLLSGGGGGTVWWAQAGPGSGPSSSPSPAIVATDLTQTVAASNPSPTAAEGRPQASDAPPRSNPRPSAVTGSETCGRPGDTSKGELLIYSSPPPPGPPDRQPESVVNAMRLAVTEHRNAAGGYRVRYTPLYDSERANASRVVQDRATVYLNTSGSAAAVSAIPILNTAGIPIVSASNTAPQITKEGLDGAVYAPLYANGPRNYFRVVPAGDVQAVADARWAKQLGARSVYVLYDDPKWSGDIADAFRTEARRIGLTTVGFSAIKPTEDSYEDLVRGIVESEADTVYLASFTQSGGGRLLRDLRAVASTEEIAFIGSGILLSGFADIAGDAAEGTYATLAAGPPGKLRGAGARFYRNYKRRYKSEPGPQAAAGYDAMGASLAAIDRACDEDPGAVLAALNSLNRYVGATGTFGFDRNGDSTLRIINGYQRRDGEWRWIEAINAG